MPAAYALSWIFRELDMHVLPVPVNVMLIT
jgi:hypothetical protein